ncbi:MULTISPECIES: phosphatase PAP2 family protein [unclassified Haematospirillum]|uniref:phosphatase PAP2 family protein n=1 Tax=unclassified Haematospirillum TaxID=2622088 RepID=UPI00143CB393|nr:MULTISPECIES: phosphatase PAP2 family protein [unclassified Haematospirillum]NKD55611.1 phosphatase PAP2 family protein [Haematospirillum sp. H4890]NKD75750.1 phosphatase PAP2 family protein [Haematospirillum sp. H4485]NKD88258.1 phosphatase PAP2 family protein [Haematospirillum sp. 15-248]
MKVRASYVWRAGMHLSWLLLSAAVFWTFPGIDLGISGLFWTPSDGWFLAHDPVPEFVRKDFPRLLIGGVVFLVCLWGILRLCHRPLSWLTGRVCAYLVISLATGPGLLANVLFKENWGRARPRQIMEFGGDSVFTPPFLVTDQCISNCSFVSGHGALGFWMTALTFVVPLRWRGRVFLTTFLAGSVVGLVRILQGGHFFSDVFYAAVLVIGVNYLLARWILGIKGLSCQKSGTCRSPSSHPS